MYSIDEHQSNPGASKLALCRLAEYRSSAASENSEAPKIRPLNAVREA